MLEEDGSSFGARDSKERHVVAVFRFDDVLLDGVAVSFDYFGLKNRRDSKKKQNNK